MKEVKYRIVKLTTNGKYIAQVEGSDYKHPWLTIGAVTGKEKWQEFLTHWFYPFEECYNITISECFNAISFYHRKFWEPRGTVPRINVKIEIE